MRSAILISFLGLAACSGQPSPDKSANVAPQAAAPTAPTTPEDKLKRAQQEVNDSFEQAMSEIPPALRNQHQAIFACTIEKNNALPAADRKSIGPDVIRAITERLARDPNASGC